MWISQEISESGKKKAIPSFGKVTSANNSYVSIRSEQEFRNLPIVCPFGVFSIPSVGANAIAVPVDNGFAFLGTTQSSANLSPGEVMLYSAGGASIVLKNNGTVLINGNQIS